MLPKELKRFGAMLVAMAMLLSCMPLSALAETTDEAVPTAPAEPVVAAEPVPVASVEIPAVVEQVEEAADAAADPVVEAVCDTAQDLLEEVQQLEDTTKAEIEEKLEDVDKAETEVEELEDLTDAAEDKVEDLETAIPDVQDAVNKETMTETEGKDALKDQHAEAEEALKAAQKQEEEAAAALELAQQEYEAAQALSEEAKAAAMEKLQAAQDKLAMAEQTTAAAKKAVDAVADTLTGIQEFVEQKHEDHQQVVEDLTAGLEESKKELDASIENLVNSSEEVKENTETLITELENLKASAEKFEEAIDNAKTTEETVLDMQAEYDEAMKALDAARAAYDALLAEGGDVTEEQVEELSKALEAAKTTAAQMQAAKEAYESETSKTYEENLATLGKEDVDADLQKIAAENVAATLIGKEGTWIPAGESEYGKSDNGFYVVLNEDGTVAGRYGYKIEDGKLNVYEMTSPESVHSVTLGGVTTEIDTTKTEIEIKDADGNTVETIYKDGETGSNYYYKEDCEVVDVVKVTKVDNENITPTYDEQGYVTSFIYSKTVKVDLGIFGSYEETYNIPLVVNDDGTIKLGNIENPTVAALANTLDLAILFKTETEEYQTVNGTKLVETNSGYFLEGTENQVFFDADGNAYFKHDAGVTESSDPKDLKFSIAGDATNGDSADEYAKKKQEAIDGYNTAVNAQNAKQSEYDKAEEQYNKLQAQLDEIAKQEAKDLEVVIPGISLGDWQITDDEVVGNLADLPVTVGDILNPDDFQDPEKLAELADAIKNLGNGNLSGAEALYNLVGLDAADILALTTAAVTGTDFQKEYAAAWTEALFAKANVIISGIQLVEQTGKTVEAGKELLESGVDAAEDILEVAQNAAKVAGYTGAVAAAQLGENAYELTSQILGKLQDKVSALKVKTDAAAKEASEAKAAVDALIAQGYDPYSEMLKAAKDRLDAANAKYNALANDLDQASAELAVAYTKIEAITAPKKHVPKNGFVLDEQRFQMRDAENNVLHFPYEVVGTTLVLTVTQEKALIIIEVAYMAELVDQNIKVLEFRTSNGTYVLDMAAFLEAQPEVTGTLVIDLEAGTYSYDLNGKNVAEKLELKK